MATQFNPKDEFQLGKGADKPPYAPNVVNQTVQYGGTTWKGNPGSDWTEQAGSSSAPTGSYSTGDSPASAANQYGAMQGFNTAYQGAIANQPSYQDLWKNIAAGFNYPQLANQATTLNNQVAMIPQTYPQAARGLDVNQNQLDRIMNMQEWKLAPLAQRATAQAQTAGQLTAQQLEAARQQQLKELAPYQTQAQLLQSILGNLTNILQTQYGVQYQPGLQGTIIQTGNVPGTPYAAFGPAAGSYTTANVNGGGKGGFNPFS